MKKNRRAFLTTASMSIAGVGMASMLPAWLNKKNNPPVLPFKLALSQFSLASQFWTKQLDPLDFPAKSMKTFGISGLDYCSMFFADKAKDPVFLHELKKRAAGSGCHNLRIMIDG
jgi:hypothetical protein